MTKLEEAARDVLQWLDTGGHTLIPLSVRMSYAEQYAAALRDALAEPAAKREGLTEGRIREIWNEMLKDGLSPLKFARAIESEVRK